MARTAAQTTRPVMHFGETLRASKYKMDARDGMPAPLYTEQAAIVHRNLGQKDKETAVLKRWLSGCSKKYRDGSRIADRLAKLEGS